MTVFRMLGVLLLAGALASVLVACGQRGPLYLPEDSAPPAATRDGGEQLEEDPEEEDDGDEVHSGSFEDGQPR